MTNPEDAKEAFLEELSSLLTKVSHKDRVFLLGDFNAEWAQTTLPGLTSLVAMALAVATPMVYTCCLCVHNMSCLSQIPSSDKPTGTRTPGCTPTPNSGT